MGGVSANPPADAQSVSDLKARLEAERAYRPFLLYRDGDDRQQLFFFEPGSADATVGRQPSSDLLLDWDAQVSRLHARFERAQDDWELVDDGFSSNGTFVNEERLSARCRLNDGDTLRFGVTTVSFTHRGLWDEEAVRSHEDGWGKLFDNLERTLEPARPNG